MSRTSLLTNQGGNTLLSALQAALPDAAAASGLAETPPAVPALDIATCFLSPAGFGTLAERLDQAARVRLLLGAEPAPEAWRTARRPGDPPPVAFLRREVAEGLRLLDEGLRRERDRQPFSPESRRHLRHMARMLRAGTLEVRRYERAFLHARAMLLDGLDPAIVVGSSNLTQAGLTTNLELNLLHRDSAAFAQARAWFDALWAEAAPFDLAAVFEEPEQEFPPWLIFLRVLWQLYGEELEQERQEAGEISLTMFQRHGVWRARRILQDYGGVVVADEVGLGKTFIAGEILSAAAKDFKRSLLVVPAALRRGWDRFLNDHNIGRFVELVSYDELARDRQFHDPARRPLAARATLQQDIAVYGLVVVDEAHNYRNPNAPYRAEVLKKLLAGQRKDLVLLTATPVNNSLWDLYQLMRYFLRQHGALAARGIPDYRARFKDAARQDPAALSPDTLYPVIDAVTVKRTRAFVRRYYAGDEIRGPDGVMRPIVFPQAVPITVRYDLDRMAPGLFDAVADALDPVNGADLLAFARYAPAAFRRDRDAEDTEAAEGAAGLLRSGLLKRFESSAHAFRLSLERMVREHELFLAALARGKVLSTAFLRELSADDEGFEEVLDAAGAEEDAAGYDVVALRAAVERDAAILRGLAGRLAAVRGAEDPKLATLVEALAAIAAQARADAGTDAEARRNRKVLVFSYFADTVAWLRDALADRIAADPRLAPYRGRIAAVAGSGLENEEASRNRAVWGFAPESSDPPPGQTDDYDLLVTTDVLAEGMNLQQCRHIINYDLPWNPMRLVQRHGRIDRIGSPHRRVFLRTVFPADRLDALLALQARILRKLHQAARSIGVATLPVDGPEAGAQVFAETRAEIERLARGDGTLFEQGGTEGAAQTGEEYRQRLRAALLAGREAILHLPGHAGSGLRRGRHTGVFFCAEVALAQEWRSFLRFLPALPGWRPPAAAAAIVRETGTCLRLIDCTEEAPRHMPPELREGVFAFWERAVDDIMAEWDDLSDPAALQPPVRPLNREVAAFLRAHPPRDIPAERLAHALDVLEAPWPRREEALLRAQFRDRSRHALRPGTAAGGLDHGLGAGAVRAAGAAATDRARRRAAGVLDGAGGRLMPSGHRQPAPRLAGIGGAGIAADRGAPHDAREVRRVEPGGGVAGAAVVPDHQVPRRPFMGVDEPRLRQMCHQLVQQRRALAGRARLQADEGAFQPVHLAMLAEIERPLARHRVHPHHRLANRALVRRQRLRRLAGQHRLPPPPGGGADMQPLQPLDAPLRRLRQRLPSRGRVGEQRLALALRHRQHAKEERDVGRRAAVALVRVPAVAVRVLHRQPAVRGQRRLRPGGRVAQHGRDVGDDEDLRHLRMHHVRRHPGLAVVLHLRPEEAAEAEQQVRRLRHRLHALDQQQAAAARQRLGQRGGFRLRQPHQRRRAGTVAQADAAAEAGARKGSEEFEAAVHAPPSCREGWPGAKPIQPLRPRSNPCAPQWKTACAVSVMVWPASPGNGVAKRKGYRTAIVAVVIPAWAAHPVTVTESSAASSSLAAAAAPGRLPPRPSQGALPAWSSAPARDASRAAARAMIAFRVSASAAGQASISASVRPQPPQMPAAGR